MTTAAAAEYLRSPSPRFAVMCKPGNHRAFQRGNAHLYPPAALRALKAIKLAKQPLGRGHDGGLSLGGVQVQFIPAICASVATDSNSQAAHHARSPP